MSVDVVLFLGRILFLLCLYLFLMFVVLSLTRDLRSRSVSVEEEAPGELVIVDPADSGLQPNDAFLLRGETLLGRSNDNTIALPDSTVSSRHVRMTHGRDGWVVEDLGSTNGTFVNGQRVSSKAKVQYGDLVSLGGVSMKLVR